jgi:hypothetical protein
MVNAIYDCCAVVGSYKHDFTSQIKKSLISTNTEFKSFDVKNSRFIQLDMSKKSLQTVNSNQWIWFTNQLNSHIGNNVFVFMANSIDTFTDARESKLFYDILSEYKRRTGKNMWVFYNGNVNQSIMDQGIKFISTCGYEANKLTQKNIHGTKFIEVTVMGKNVTYQIKPIIAE